MNLNEIGIGELIDEFDGLIVEGVKQTKRDTGVAGNQIFSYVNEEKAEERIVKL